MCWLHLHFFYQHIDNKQITSLYHSNCSHAVPPSCHRSDKQPAGHPNDPGSSHQRPGQRAEPAEGQGPENGGREGGPAKPEPSSR